MLADEDLINIIPKTQIFLNYFIFVFGVILIVQTIGILFNKIY